MPQLSKQKEISLILSSFAQSSIGIFSAFSSVPVKATGARKIDEQISETDIYGTILFVGIPAGKVEICLNKDMARQLAANIALCEPEELSDEDVYDGVGEIINQIAGNTRTLLWDEGFKTEISTPAVTDESNLSEYDKKRNQSIYIIDFDCSAGFVALQICLRFTEKKPIEALQS
ncbi:MAG: chemotaxis protein CheX [candidate division Zixibacteria bacterium]|nr:chemotaxis protein CheX [candidate division Zixibacteria bacterium]